MRLSMHPYGVGWASTPPTPHLTIVQYGRDRIGTLITFNDDGHLGQ
jgi:hypothetical protein